MAKIVLPDRLIHLVENWCSAFQWKILTTDVNGAPPGCVGELRKQYDANVARRGGYNKINADRRRRMMAELDEIESLVKQHAPDLQIWLPRKINADDEDVKARARDMEKLCWYLLLRRDRPKRKGGRTPDAQRPVIAKRVNELKVPSNRPFETKIPEIIRSEFGIDLGWDALRKMAGQVRPKAG